MNDDLRQARLWLELWRDLGVEAVAPRRRAQAGAQVRLAAVAAEAADAAGEGGAAVAAPPVAGDPVAALAAIREWIGDCRRCRLCEGRTNIVFGVGNPRARLMFVGEGPGADEDLRGEPFVGRAGQLLDRIIAAMGLARADVYIANVVKCRPPENRNPLPDEAATCLPFLAAQIAAIRPEVIVTLGKVALEGLIGRPVSSITRERGRWLDYDGIPLKVTFHPAYLLRNPDAKRPVWDDMRDVLERLGLPIPISGRGAGSEAP